MPKKKLYTEAEVRKAINRHMAKATEQQWREWEAQEAARQKLLDGLETLEGKTESFWCGFQAGRAYEVHEAKKKRQRRCR